MYIDSCSASMALLVGSLSLTGGRLFYGPSSFLPTCLALTVYIGITLLHSVQCLFLISTLLFAYQQVKIAHNTTKRVEWKLNN